jgi:organic radical activating enzyme
MASGAEMHDLSTPNLYKGARTLSVMPTYACPAQCKNCGTVSSPHDRNSISLETMLSAIDQARDLGFANVVFTGGEPTIRWIDLVHAIRHASSLRLPTRLVTNAHWATNDEEAIRRIRELVDAGLSEINYSTGDEHVRYIPLDNVVNGIVSALQLRLTLAVTIELRAARSVNKESLLAHPKIKVLDSQDKARIRVLESPWMPLNPFTIEKYPEDVAVNNKNIASRGGCDSVLQSYVVQADGRIGACCGLGMRIIPELNVGVSKGDHFLRNAILDAESDLLKLLVHYKGPEKLLAWAANKDPNIKWENLYAHKCQSCLRIYKDPRVGDVIRNHHSELISDVLQAAWIEEELYPALIESAGVNVQPTYPVHSHLGSVRKVTIEIKLPYPSDQGATA